MANETLRVATALLGPQAMEPGYSKERKFPVVIELPDFMNGLFPEIRNTEVASILSSLTIEIDPLCGWEKNHENKIFWVRGSTIKRHLLGDPQSYWDISRIFSQADHEQYQNEARDLVDKFAIGPRDIDLRYSLLDGKTDLDVYSSMVVSLVNKGFRNQGNNFYQTVGNQDYRIEIIKTPIGGVNGDPRLFFNVNIYVDGVFKIRADFGQLAHLDDLEQHHDEFRLNLYSPPVEIRATGDIKVSEENGQKKAFLMIEDYALISSFNDPSSIKLWYYTSLLPLVLNGKLKGIGFRTFWPNLPDKKTYSYQKLLQLFTEADYPKMQQWLYLHYDGNMDKRRFDFMSDFLLYLTYDPFLFLQLGYDCRLFDIVPFDDYSINGKDFSRIMNFMKKEMMTKIGQMEVSPYRKFNIPRLSRLYKETVLSNSLQIEDTGPFMLLRAINRLLESEGRAQEKLPETLEQAIALFDPLGSSIVRRIKSEINA